MLEIRRRQFAKTIKTEEDYLPTFNIMGKQENNSALLPENMAEDITPYYFEKNKKEVLSELFNNAYRTLRSVYIFKNFEEYVVQLESDQNEDKLEVYWNASYYEKLIDYIKICVAFENYNKAVLLQKGYLVHEIKKNPNTKDLFNNQSKGVPVKIDDFVAVGDFTRERPFGEYVQEGLKPNLSTISYSKTLNDNYQKIIGLDPTLLFRLKGINSRRNRLHFFTEFRGAFEVSSHIQKWRQIKDLSIATLEEKVKKKR